MVRTNLAMLRGPHPPFNSIRKQLTDVRGDDWLGRPRLIRFSHVVSRVGTRTEQPCSIPPDNDNTA